MKSVALSSAPKRQTIKMFASSIFRHIRTSREKAKKNCESTRNTRTKKEERKTQWHPVKNLHSRTQLRSRYLPSKCTRNMKLNTLGCFFLLHFLFFFMSIVGVCRRSVRWCANNMMNVEKHLTFSFSFSSYALSCSLFCMSFCFVIRPLIVCLNVYSLGHVCVTARPIIFFLLLFIHFRLSRDYEKRWRSSRKMKMKKKDGSRIMD